MYTKALGILTGIATIIIAIGFGLLALLGAGLSDALHSSTDYSLPTYFGMVIAIIIAIGLITCIGAFKVRNQKWAAFYTWFCMVLGIGTLIISFFSIVALGTSSGLFLMFVGALYVLLGFLSKWKK